MKLLGFGTSIWLELQFTGLELLHFLHGAKMHYDGECKAAALHAGKGAQLNGLLITTMMRMDAFSWDAIEPSDEEFLLQNADAMVTRSFRWGEVDLLCKITECFNLIATLKVLPLGFSKDVACNIMIGLRRALNEATEQQKLLNEQEKERRERTSN